MRQFQLGDDDASNKMSQVYNENANELVGMKIVAIKVDAKSENCKMFSQICMFFIFVLFQIHNNSFSDPVIVVPSTYFIDNNGVPIEIVAGALDADAFMTKLKNVLDSFNKSIAGSSQKSAEQTSKNEEKSEVAAASSKSDEEKIKESSSSKPKSESKVESTQAEQSGNLDDKVERAQQLLDSIREKKAKEEEEKQKSDEMKRRQEFKEMHKAKKLREEKEYEETIKQREKEKLESKLAKERVLAQIAADKAERKARESLFKPETKSPDKSVETKSSTFIQTSNEFTRIQFKMPDGSSFHHQFLSKDSLLTVRQYLVTNAQINHFTLSTSFPRRLFTPNDFDSTLEHLGLSPSSVLLVLFEERRSKAIITSSGSTFSYLIALLLTPITLIWNYISNFLGSFVGRTQVKQSQQATSSGASPKASTSKSSYGKEGNIVRLRKKEKDDDENNTWNGNSTQQM